MPVPVPVLCCDSKSKPWLSKLTPLETQTQSTPTCSLKPDKLATRSFLFLPFASVSFFMFFAFFVWVSCFVSLYCIVLYCIVYDKLFRLAMLSTRVWIRNPIRDPLRSLLLGSYTRLNVKTPGLSLTKTAVLLG